MSDNLNNSDDTPIVEPATADDTPAVAKKPDTDTADFQIPKARFDEINSKYKALLESQEKAQAAQAAAEKKRLEEENKFKELYEQAEKRIGELEPYEGKFTAYQEQVLERNRERIEAIPEAMRSLVPEYDDPFKVQGWLDNNQSIFSKPTAPKLDAGAGSKSRKGGGDEPTEDQIKEQAAVLGVSFEYLKQQYYGDST